MFCSYDDPVEEMSIKGRSLLTGLPETITVTSTETKDAFQEVAESIVDAVKGVIEVTPPELVGDISTNGIVMTGGGSMIKGLDKLISLHTGINCTVADDAVSCVALGTGKALEHIDILQEFKIEKYTM